MNSASPFKGPDSFNTSEQRRFFGREVDTLRIRELVRTNAISLLHAPSGAGKTSLLRAALSPILEHENEWIAAISRPGNDPALEAKLSILLRLFPSFEAEAESIRRLIEISSEAKTRYDDAELQFPKSLTLVEARRRFQALRARSLQQSGPTEATEKEDGGSKSEALIDRRSWHAAESLATDVLSPREISFELDGTQRIASTMTIFQRFLESRFGHQLLVRHIASYLLWRRLRGRTESNEIVQKLNEAEAAGDIPAFTAILNKFTLGELDDLLTDPEMSKDWDEFMKLHLAPETSLFDFFERLYFDWFELETFAGNRDFGVAPPTGVVVVFDQFEEMFTRYAPGGDPSIANRSDVKAEFFEQLRELSLGRMDEEGKAEPLSMPLRIVLSMRDEHVAQLDDIRVFASGINSAAYHLEFIPDDRARAIIERPAERHGLIVENEVLDTVVNGIVREDGSVEPILVQIIMETVWQRHGDRIAREIAEAGEASLTQDDLLELGSTQEILRSFLIKLVDNDGEEPRRLIEKFEMLTLLDDLVMGGNRRAIVERDVLVDRVGHARDVRIKMLELLVERGIVREERRASGTAPFAEVSHERIIPSINYVIIHRLRNDRQLQDLRQALSRLASLKLSERRRMLEPAFPFNEILALSEQAEELNLSADAIEIITRTALLHGAPTDMLMTWAKRFDDAGQTIDFSKALDVEAGVTLDRVELRKLAEAGWSGDDDEPIEHRNIAHMLLRECELQDSDLIRKFIRESVAWND